MMRFHKKRGFTLLELMIVIIIVGILASLAMPRFITAANRAREAEAMSILGSIRSAQLRYYLEHNRYTGNDKLSLLDLDVPTTTDYYNYDTGAASSQADGSVLGDATAIFGGLSNYQIEQDGDIVTF